MAGVPDFQGMLNQINFDYNKAVSAANQLTSAAENLDRCLSSMRGTADSVGAAWKGANANRYLEKLNHEAAELQSLIAQIRTTAGGITDTAKVYMQSQQSKVRSQMQAYEAEMRARNQ